MYIEGILSPFHFCVKQWSFGCITYLRSPFFANFTWSKMKVYFLLTFCLVFLTYPCHWIRYPTASMTLPPIRSLNCCDWSLVCSDWNHLSLWRRPTSRSSSQCLLILLGDIELNPGPGPRHPCGSCNRTVLANQRGIFVSVAITGTIRNV